MGLFDNILGNREQKNEEKHIREERDFVRQRDIYNTAVQPDQDQTYERESRSDLIRWQQELDDELFKLVQDLLGKTQTAKDKWVQTGEQLCNERFIAEVVIPQCRPFLSRNMINTKYEEYRILSDLKNTIHDIIDIMSDKFEDYKIDFRNFDNVLRIIKNTINPGAYRAFQGWTKKMDSTMIKRVESSSEQSQQQKSGGLFGG